MRNKQTALCVVAFEACMAASWWLGGLSVAVGLGIGAVVAMGAVGIVALVS